MVDSLNFQVGRRIMEVRKNKRWSRKNLAEKADISAHFLSLVEKGERGLSSHTIRSLSLALNVTADFILFGKTDTNHRLDYSSQAFTNLTDNEQDNILKLFDFTVDLLRGYSPPNDAPLAVGEKRDDDAEKSDGKTTE